MSLAQLIDIVHILRLLASLTVAQDSSTNIAVKGIGAFTPIRRCNMDSPIFMSTYNKEKQRFECVITFSNSLIAFASKSLETEVLAAKLNDAYEEAHLEINTNFMLVEALG